VCSLRTLIGPQSFWTLGRSAATGDGRQTVVRELGYFYCVQRISGYYRTAQHGSITWFDIIPGIKNRKFMSLGSGIYHDPKKSQDETCRIENLKSLTPETHPAHVKLVGRDSLTIIASEVVHRSGRIVVGDAVIANKRHELNICSHKN
jgi:hypothetical protein